tara:strand:- start:531 stop:782 length:252 start_codon:yes stop_codon:yes gene_type:complete
MKDSDVSWKKIKCCCSNIDNDVENKYPISKCIHCKCKDQEESMPRESFEISEFVDKKIVKREIKEITIKRSSDGYNSILGWSF